MNRNNALREILPIVIITIVGTYFFSYVSYLLIEEELPGNILELWNKWDTGHYLNIVENGYGSPESDRKELIAFFPLYPYLVKALGSIFQSYMFTALLISNLAYIAAAYYFYRIVNIDYEKEDARRAVIYLSIFPTAYFLHAGYTEGLFMALSIGSFYYARTKRWWLSGIFGMLAAATRITGILLLPALIIEYMAQRDYKLSAIRADIVWVLLIGLGLFSYLVLNYLVSGDPFYFLNLQQETWLRKLALPYEGFINSIWGMPGYQKIGAYRGDIAEILFALLGLAGVVYSFFKLRLSYSIYVLLIWLIITSSQIWLSIPRFTLTMFPLIILLVLFGRRLSVNFAIMFLSLLCFALLLTQFLTLRGGF